MLEKIKFVNHIQEEMTLGEGGIYVNSNIPGISRRITIKYHRFTRGLLQRQSPLLSAAIQKKKGF